MAKEQAKAADGYAAGVQGAGGQAFEVPVPYLAMDVACYGPEGLRWTNKIPHNVVVNQGRGYLLNRVFGSGTASSAGAGLFLHSASAGSNNVWADISASQVHSYGASMPALTFASTHTAGLATATASYNFTASTQTVSGAGLVMYTSASIATSITAGAAALYCYGTFTGSRQVVSGDTLNVTVSLSLATA